MNIHSTTGPHAAAHAITTRQIAAGLLVGTIGVLTVGIQPIVLGELVDARQVTLESVGIVAMGEIISLGLGVVVGDLLLPASRLRLVTIVAALLAAAFDLVTLRTSGDGQMLAVRVAAGLAEGMLVWSATGVVVRSANAARVAGIFFVAQTLAQAALGAALAHVVIPHAGWKGCFETLASLSLLPCAFAFVQPARLARRAPAAVSAFRWTVATALPLLVAFLQLAALGSFWAYLEPLGRVAGFDARSAQTLVSGVLAMQVLGGSVATVAVRRLAAVPALVLSSAVLAAATLAAHALPAGWGAPFALACALFGFTWLFMMPFQIDLALRADPSKRLAGLVPAAQLLGSAFGPLVASFVVKGDDAGAVPVLSACFAVAAALLVLVSRRRLAIGAAGGLAR